jgi:hypothetical protein
MNLQGAVGTVTASRTCPCSSCAAKSSRRCHTAEADLFQLLWCPYVHFEGPPNEPPGFLAFWRREADIADPLLVEPPKTDGIDLFECRLNAEYITEYPCPPRSKPISARTSTSGTREAPPFTTTC